MSPPTCESCQTPTRAVCPRCGRRICRACSPEHWDSEDVHTRKPCGAAVILVTNVAAVSRHETTAKASRQAHRWLRRRVAVAGEWATILHPETGAVRARYVRRVDGRVERAQ